MKKLIETIAVIGIIAALIGGAGGAAYHMSGKRAVEAMNVQLEKENVALRTEMEDIRSRLEAIDARAPNAVGSVPDLVNEPFARNQGDGNAPT